MKTCKIITISVYHPTEGHYLRYKVYDKVSGSYPDEFDNRCSAYRYAKQLGYNRVYGLTPEDKKQFKIKGIV